jgi:hypothetical protein
MASYRLTLKEITAKEVEALDAADKGTLTADQIAFLRQYNPATVDQIIQKNLQNRNQTAQVADEVQVKSYQAKQAAQKPVQSDQVLMQSGYVNNPATTKLVIKDDAISDYNGLKMGSSADKLNSLDFYYNGQKENQRFQKDPFYIALVDENENLFPLGVSNNEQIVAIKLLVSPASVSFNMSKIVMRSQSMVGWIEEHWGEELDTISFQGSSASFVLGEIGNIRDISYGTMSPDKFNSEPIGLTTGRRRETIGYKEFRRIIQIMSSNACDFDSNTGFVKTRRFIKLSWNYASILGYIESFDTVEEATTPFKLTYQMTFKAERTDFLYMK